MRIVTGLAAMAALSGCMLNDFGGVNRAQVYGAVSKYELMDLGAAQLSGEEITLALAGKTFVEPNENWIWEIDAEGGQQALASDGSWADDPDGTWEVRGDQFCRANADIEERCSDVFRIGNYYRMTEADGSLAIWTITEG